MTEQLEFLTPRTRGNTVIEEIRLAQGQITQPASSPAAPVPAPAVPLPPFAAGSETSRQAAIAKHDAGDAISQQSRIYELLCAAGAKGMIREEIEQATGLDGNTVRPRLLELLGEAKGYTADPPYVRRSGKTRKTSKGRNAEVLVTI